MPMPEFQSIMRPLLELLQDGQDRSIHEVSAALADVFALTPEERAEPLPSGKQPRFHNRVSWASSHLTQAGLLVRPGRARIQITSRGLDAVTNGPGKIDMAFLAQYPEFREFRKRSGASPTPTPTPIEQADTPEEAFLSSHQQMRAELAAQVREKVATCTPAFFERLVVDLLVAMGYGGTRTDAAQVVGGSGDGGIDGIIKEDKLGLDVVYLQAKRWRDNVSRPTVQAFAGSLEMHRAKKGVLITTSDFTADARSYVKMIEKRIVLIDGAQLAELMMDHGIGVTDVQTYVVRRIDTDYFEES